MKRAKTRVQMRGQTRQDARGRPQAGDKANVILPPEAPLDMPVQRLERPRAGRRWWLRLRLAVLARAGF